MMLKGIILKYLFSNSYVRVLKGGKCNISSKAKIKHCNIYVYSGGELTIGDNVKLENVDIYVQKGKIQIGNNSIIKSRRHRVEINIESGNVEIGENDKIASSRIWCRFGGNIKIGDYTNINDGSEIRSDERIEIGSFNQISYNVRIWDTNTHQILPKSERRKLTKDYFPYFGKELQSPKTSPVFIGDDCWIGEQCAILKGVTIGDESVIGFGTFITNKIIPKNSCVYNNNEIVVTKV